MAETPESILFSDKPYSHTEVESKWTQLWGERKLFATQINNSKQEDGSHKFSIALPPPNVTGELHMGHAFSGTFQDFLIRKNRMQGKDVLWQIGTDHAGIGTQIVVEKFLKKNEKLSKHDLGREKFIERTKVWKDEYGNKILEQMKKLGFSPDWDRCRYTMDEHYARCVKTAFKKYFDEGIIYRGKRVVNWCPHCQTSLSDLEITKEQTKGKLYHIKYPIVGKGFIASGQFPPDNIIDLNNPENYIVVATTRPETMFGDTAVAVHPDDERYKNLVGKQAIFPSVFSDSLTNRYFKLRIVADNHVKPEFGTGAIKVTPAHDANDFEIGKRQNLEQKIVLDQRAKMMDSHDVPYVLHELDRYEARDKIVEELEAKGYLEKVTEYDQDKDLHDRCHTEIEPYLNNQWYVKMDLAEDNKNLSQIAINTVKNKQSSFMPERYETIFLNWLENIRDWCISRQIWWGHRIPVYYYIYEKENGDCKLNFFSHVDENSELDKLLSKKVNQHAESLKSAMELCSTHVNIDDNSSYSFNGVDSKSCARLISFKIERDFKTNTYDHFEKLAKSDKILYFWQDPDVLDTWFSSALWPFETLKAGSDSKETPEVFDHFYPTDVLATAREIINLWVTRMIFSSQYFEGKAPFKDILIHPVIQTPDGKRMSKSKGNAIDPLAMVDKYGADASRMWYASVGIYGSQDVRFPGKFDKSKNEWSSDTLEQYRRFANKLFNASKFVVLNLGDDFKPQKIQDLDPSKLNIVDKWILDKFHGMLAAIETHDEYDFGFYTNSIYEFLWFSFCDWYIEFSKNNISEESKQILFHILEASLRVLHPVMPFITEEIWQGLKSKYDFKNINNEILNSNLEAKYQESICFAQQPKAKKQFVQSDLAGTTKVDYIISLISCVRNARQTLGIAWTNEIELYLNAELDRNYQEMNQSDDLQEH